jgi:vacuolar protein sorting-associated protein 18
MLYKTRRTLNRQSIFHHFYLTLLLTKNVYRAIQFLENADLLKIEDILPFFPDFVVIDDFKEEIAHALEGYSAQIETLKGEMDEATRTAEAIKQDIAALKNRFITIDANDQCSTCSTLLLTRQFYVFPCHHTFHADCLIGLVCHMCQDMVFLLTGHSR